MRKPDFPENVHMHEENMQSSHRKKPVGIWTQDLLAVIAHHYTTMQHATKQN